MNSVFKIFFSATKNVAKRSMVAILCMVLVGLSFCATAQPQNSVALEAIISPVNAKPAYSIDTITVVIRNMGTNNLDSCYIFCFIMDKIETGVLLMPRIDDIYRNGEGLPSGVADTVTVKCFFPTPPCDYVACVWVSMPNGVEDSVTNDDTLCINVCVPSVFSYADTIYSGEVYNDANFSNLTQSGTYYDTLQNINGCDSIIELTLTVTNVGVNELKAESGKLKVYPNPTTGQLIVEIADQARNDAWDFTIYSVVGQVVMQGVLPCRDAINRVSTIDVESLPSGMYFLKIGNKAVKFVKE